MNSSFDTRLKRGLFPEMPQSFADGLLRAAETAGGTQNRSAQTDAAKSSATGAEPKKRRFPIGKVLAGAAAAVLVAASVVIAVFAPGIGRSSHGATDPVVDPLLGKWTVTEIRIDDNIVDPKTIGDVQITLELSEDGNATLSGVAPQGDIRGDIQERGQYTVTGNMVILTDEEGDTLELTYDPAADTLYMEHTYSGEYDLTLGLIFSRTPDAVKTLLPEDMLEGLWCALSGDPDQVLLLEIRFYTDAATSERKAEIIKDGISRDGYSYTVEKWEQSQKNTGNLWYRFTFIGGDEELTIDLCMDTDGKEPIYMDWNLDKSEEGQKTYLKCPPIEADELPMQYTEYYGAGEGFVGFLAAVDLNGDGNPVRVTVTSNDPNWFIEKGEEPELTVQIGRGEWTANEVLVWDSVIFADLDPNDGHGNVLLSVKRADETIFTYELHSEGDTVVCGHVGEGYSNTYAMSTNINLYEKTSVGAWSYAYSVDYEQRITIRADGTATLKQWAGVPDALDIQLTYTEQDGELRFMSVDTGINDPLFSAVYDAERDVLAVTMNGETAEYERCIPDLANSFWTMTEMIWNDGRHASAEEAGVESTLTFQDGTMTELRTVNANGLTSRTEYRYLTEADSVLLRANGMDVNDPEITYDPETDTLRLFTSDDGRTCVFVRTPDLVGKWTVTGVELNGSPDTSGSWMHEEFLEFSGKNSVTWTEYDAAVGNYRSEQYRYSVSGNAVALRKDDATAHTTLTYDPATDTLRLDADVSYSNPAAPHDVVTSIFSRMPDAVIPTLTPDSAVDALQQEYKRLEKQYPEYFGLDISKGLKVYVWQMSNDGYFCALLAGSDNKTDVEIGGMKGTTIEEMLLILNTYETEDNDIDVEVVPFRNPLSSYWYEIDEAYTEKLVWLLNGTPNPAPFLTESSESGETAYQVDDPEHILNVLTDVEVCDVNGDGQLESCRLSFGPTSGLFTVVFTVYRNGTLAYRNTFNMDYGTANFVLLDKGLSLEFVFAKNEPWTVRYLVTIENGVIVLTNMVSGNQVEYWGTADPHWNMKGGA